MELGEKIRDWMTDIAIRFSQLDRSPDSYKNHADTWARHKNELSFCIQKFQDKGCGNKDLPPKIRIEGATELAKQKAPPVTNFQQFVNGGGVVPVVVIVCSLCPECCFGVLPGATQPSTVPEGVPDTDIIMEDEWIDDSPMPDAPHEDVA
jgi:hypothetical protein